MLWFTCELQRRMAGRKITANAVCPGFVPATAAASTTGLMRLAMVHALQGIGGEFFGGRHVIESSPQSRDTDQARRFWDLAQRLTGFPYPS
ncbi:MAG: hypothetical protein ACXVW8_15860 [Nocardioidaceae bacterium]